MPAEKSLKTKKMICVEIFWTVEIAVGFGPHHHIKTYYIRFHFFPFSIILLLCFALFPSHDVASIVNHVYHMRQGQKNGFVFKDKKKFTEFLWRTDLSSGLGSLSSSRSDSFQIHSFLLKEQMHEQTIIRMSYIRMIVLQVLILSHNLIADMKGID